MHAPHRRFHRQQVSPEALGLPGVGQQLLAGRRLTYSACMSVWLYVFLYSCKSMCVRLSLFT
jgi:hypothetical protein